MGSSNVSTSVAGNFWKTSEPGSFFLLEHLESLRLLVIFFNASLCRAYERYQCHFSSMNKAGNSTSYPNEPNNDEALIKGNLPKETNQNFNTELKNALSETEETLKETVNTFRLLQTYLQWPSEETSKPLKLLFDRGKNMNFFTREKMDAVFSLLESSDSHQGSVDATTETCTPCHSRSSSGSDQESFSPLGCQMGSISDDAIQKELKETKTRKNPVIRRASKESFKLQNDQVFLLEHRLKSLNDEREAIFSKLGEISFIQKKREREERSSGIFRQIFPPSLPNFDTIQFSGCQGDGNSSNNNNSFGYTKDDPTTDNSNGVNCNGWTSNSLSNDPRQTTKKRSNSIDNTAVGLESTLEGGYHQTGKKRMAIRAKGKSGLLGGSPTVQNELRVNPEEKTTGGEGIKSEAEKITTDPGIMSRDGRNLSIQQNEEMQITSNPTSCVQQKENEVGKNESGTGRTTDPLTSTSRDETYDQSLVRQSSEGVSFSVQQDDSNAKEFISLASKPPISVATTLYNNYKRLLLTFAQSLLSSEVIELKNWASEKFSIENPQNATDVFFQLDEKGAINAEDLSQLCDFFKSIVRYDLVHIIEGFLLGDYSLFRLIPSSKNRDPSRVRNSQLGRSPRYGDLFSADSSRRSSVSSIASVETVRNPATSVKPRNNNEPPSSVARQIQQAASSNFSVLPNPSQPGKLFSRTPNENQSTARVQQDLTPTATGFPFPPVNKVAVVDGSTVSQERRTMAANVSTRTNSSMTNSSRNTQSVGSNGLKHSKFQRPSAVSDSRAPSNSLNLEAFNQDDNWLCSHYKRHCFVKFECCDKFWPCHRCHNNQSTCGRKKLKSRDTKMLKCVYCNKEQQFGQFCCDCGAKFSNYFCDLCKHLTGHDDFPYHCDKCGICRIHGDRSFHCDVCGVCLDVQLRGNHKCREGSAHDECCICLEDAFTGCQILPCSHKVHKECATQMIRSGITRCPICRESFAHKLERRPTANSKTHSRK